MSFPKICQQVCILLTGCWCISVPTERCAPAGGDLNLFCLCLHYCSLTLLLKTAPVRMSPSLWLQRISCLKGSKRNHSATTEPTSLSPPPPCFCSYLFNNIKPKSTPLNAISSLTLKHFSKVDWALQFLQMD